MKTLAGCGVDADILAGAERVEHAGAVLDGLDTASAGKTVTAESPGLSAKADPWLEAASGFAATVDCGTSGNNAKAGLQTTQALSSAYRLAAGAWASGRELRGEVDDFTPAFNLALAEAVFPLLPSDWLSTGGFAMGCVFRFASAKAVEKFPGMALPPAVWGGVLTEIWGKLTITASPQPGSEFARGWPDGAD